MDERERIGILVAGGVWSVQCEPVTKAVVKAYIRGQQEHHKKRNFEEEFLLLLKKSGIDYEPRYVFD
jgi:hypothetical protein